MAAELVSLLLVLASLSMVSCQKPDDCWNNYPCCDSWRAQGYCRSTTDFMALACPLACGYCRPNFRESSDGNCFNHFDACEHWSRTGSCSGVDRLFMEENCRAACQKCSVSKSFNCGRPPQKECYNDDPCCDFMQQQSGCGEGYLATFCRRSCRRCEDHINAYGDCIDFFPMCKAKARNGQCEARPKWMNENCRAACGKCGQPRNQGCQVNPPDNCGRNEVCKRGQSCDEDCQGNRLCSRNKRDASTTFVHYLTKRQVPAELPPPRPARPPPPPGSCKCRCINGYVRQQRDDKSPCVPRSSCTNQKCGQNERCVRGTSCDTDCFGNQVCSRSKRQSIRRPPPPPGSCSCRCVPGYFRQYPRDLDSACVQRHQCPVQ